MTTRTRTAKTAAATPAKPTATRTRKPAAEPAPVAAKPAPRKRTAPAKVAEPVAEVKPTRSRKSASASSAKEASPAEIAQTLKAVEETANSIAKMIAAGTLDEFIAVIDNAVGERLDFFEEEKKKEAAAKRAATRAANKSAPAESAKIAEKLVPVSRAKKEPVKEPESASAHKVGAAYIVAGLAKLHGAKVRFLGYTDETGTKAQVEMREEHTGGDGVKRAAGKKLAVPSTRLVTAQAFARLNKS